MPKLIEQIIEEFCDALQPGDRYEMFIANAEAEGYPQVAKMFRAVIESEAIRERLIRKSLPNHIDRDWDYFVCPLCGLLYEPEPPDQCPIDQTPADRFIRFC
jgi:rubrerythrin